MPSWRVWFPNSRHTELIRTKKLTIGIAAVIGGLMPLRPLLFGKTSDPTSESYDLLLSPGYLVGRSLPTMGDVGSLILMTVTMLTNALLYGLLARYVYSKFFEQSGPGDCC